MCWSGEASTVLASVGLGSTAYLACRGEDKRLWLPLAYFSLMEALQAYTYSVIDQCSNPANQLATLLGYLHIVFQPFFINMFSLYFVPQGVRDKIEFWVYVLVGVGSVSMLVTMYPFSWGLKCDPNIDPFCGNQICSISGDWHIAWEIPRWVFSEELRSKVYPITGFLLPLLYGSWKMTLYHFLTGPLLAFLLTGSLNEWAAVWCLFSIGLLLVAVKSPLRSRLHVRAWPFWRYLTATAKV